jgi:imidazole glycerol-phosphate synthase subunit HisH
MSGSNEVVIVDYGMANLRSVQKAFEKVGTAAVISSDPDRVHGAAKVVLPGVGAFEDAIGKLRDTGLAEAVTDHIDAGKPFLGICLGLHMLFSRSHEGGNFTGLNLFAGDVVRFTPEPGLKIPHMGWNTLNIRMPKCPLFHGLPPDSAFYFVHGYYAMPTDASSTSAEADYPGPFCAALWRDNVFATQFHPEKSQAVGQLLLRNFAGL